MSNDTERKPLFEAVVKATSPGTITFTSKPKEPEKPKINPRLIPYMVMVERWIAQRKKGGKR